MTHKQVDYTGMERMSSNIRETATTNKKKEEKKKKKQEKKEQKYARQKNKVIEQTKKSGMRNSGLGIGKVEGGNDLENAKNVSQFSRGHSSYKLNTKKK